MAPRDGATKGGRFDLPRTHSDSPIRSKDLMLSTSLSSLVMHHPQKKYSLTEMSATVV